MLIVVGVSLRSLSADRFGWLSLSLVPGFHCLSASGSVSMTAADTNRRTVIQNTGFTASVPFALVLIDDQEIIPPDFDVGGDDVSVEPSRESVESRQ